MRPAAPVTAPDGTRLAAHAQRPTTDDAVVGTVHFERHDFTAPGQEGRGPLDAELSLPARWYADLLWEWTADGATDASSRESQTVMERILGLSRSLQALATAVVEAAWEMTPVDEWPAELTALPPDATMLVVHADSTGVPMVPPPTTPPSVRLGKEQKQTKKTEAVVTALDTINPDQRTPRR